jgi:hypothetical protein
MWQWLQTQLSSKSTFASNILSQPFHTNPAPNSTTSCAGFQGGDPCCSAAQKQRCAAGYTAGHRERQRDLGFRKKECFQEHEHVLYAPGLLALVSAARSVAASIATNDSHRNLCCHPVPAAPSGTLPPVKSQPLCQETQQPQPPLAARQPFGRGCQRKRPTSAAGLQVKG